jgi:hypothetical protein
MKTLSNALMSLSLVGAVLLSMGNTGCENDVENNRTALDEQKRTEANQAGLFAKQPPPRLTWSLERDNLIKRFKLQNDRTVSFYMYVFIEGVGVPIGYYQVNKVSSVDSQLTNTSQIVAPFSSRLEGYVLPSPAEDGSYGTNGAGVFGFTPEDIYIEHNMHYIVSSIPLSFATPVPLLAIVNTPEAKVTLEASKKVMSKD